MTENLGLSQSRPIVKFQPSDEDDDTSLYAFHLLLFSRLLYYRNDFENAPLNNLWTLSRNVDGGFYACCDHLPVDLHGHHDIAQFHSSS